MTSYASFARLLHNMATKRKFSAAFELQSLELAEDNNHGNQIKAFQHQPLDYTKQAIRVFKVLPGPGPVCCKMRHTGKVTEHTAISYVWGPTSPSYRVLIDGGTFMVRSNLYDFLVQVRHSKKDFDGVWFWVDAICIDQNNVAERNHQVSQMGQIYQNAKQVISWLGRRTPETDAVFYLVKSTVAATSNARVLSAAVQRRKLIFSSQVHQINAFCLLPYWTRTWIVQEVLLASRADHILACGSSRISMALVREVLLASEGIIDNQNRHEIVWKPAMVLLRHSQNRLNDLRTQERHSIASMDTLRPQLSLRLLIDRYKSTECADPRDHVYALSMLWPENTTRIKADYGLSRAALFWEVLSVWSQNDPQAESFNEALSLAKTLHADMRTLRQESQKVQIAHPPKITNIIGSLLFKGLFSHTSPPGLLPLMSTIFVSHDGHSSTHNKWSNLVATVLCPCGDCASLFPRQHSGTFTLKIYDFNMQIPWKRVVVIDGKTKKWIGVAHVDRNYETIYVIVLSQLGESGDVVPAIHLKNSQCSDISLSGDGLMKFFQMFVEVNRASWKIDFSQHQWPGWCERTDSPSPS